MAIEVEALAIADVKLIKPALFGDDRGFFMESWNRRDFAAAGIDTDFLQDNHSRSQRGTLRGLHYQLQQPQGKLVRVTRGEVFDVAVDLRRHSTTFRHWVGVHLSAENHYQLWVPPGFAHGFYVVSEQAEFLYKCSGHYYAPSDERAIRWDDPTLAIDWPLVAGAEPLLSAKDRTALWLEEAPCYD